MVDGTGSDIWGSLGYTNQDSPLSPDIPDHLIPVERVETLTSLRRKRKREAFYVNATYRDLDRLAESMCGRSAIFVWLHLRSLQSTKGPEAWVRTNPEVLLAWKIPKRTYQQALVDLAEAGLIEIDVQPGRKTRVRLKPAPAGSKGR